MKLLKLSPEDYYKYKPQDLIIKLKPPAELKYIDMTIVGADITQSMLRIAETYDGEIIDNDMITEFGTGSRFKSKIRIRFKGFYWNGLTIDVFLVSNNLPKFTEDILPKYLQ